MKPVIEGINLNQMTPSKTTESPKGFWAWLKQIMCSHPKWVKRPDLNVLYACGEDGAYGWSCVDCGTTKLTDDDIEPGDPREVYLTGWPEHPKLLRRRGGNIVYGGGGIGFRRVTHPASSMMLKQYEYWCSCGTKLTDGPTGGAAVNAVCRTCKLNYGNLPGYWGS